MARSHNIVGLTSSASLYLKDHCEDIGMHDKVYDAFGDLPIYDLHRYKDLSTGEIYKEVVEKEPWESGPETYICLQNEETGEYEFPWGNDE